MAARKKPHWTQTPEGKKHMQKMNRRRQKLRKEGKANGQVVAHIEPKGKPSAALYNVRLKPQNGSIEVELQDVPRREVLGLIGRLMKS